MPRSRRKPPADAVTTVTDFSRIFTSDAFLSEPVIVVAVSGGSDSTALLFRAKDKISSDSRLVAVTVDHGLRPESADESAAVGALCASHNIEHKVVRWEGDKPATGIQAAARLARYALLTQATVDLGGRLILTGHTADDQAETISMRMERGEGIGLAGIAPMTLHQRKVWFVRPQLGKRRATLREELQQRGIGWINDPSNENEAFERVRVRRDMSMLSDDDFTRLIKSGERAAARRVELGRRAAGVISRYAQLSSANTPTPNPSPQGGGGLGGGAGESPSPLWGGVRGGGKDVDADAIGLGRSFLLEQPDAAIHALRILLATVGATEQLPDLKRTGALFQRLQETERGRFSLARAVIAKRKGEIVLTRERRGNSARPNEGALTICSPWQHLLPCFDIEPARAIDELLGKTPPPALPWP
ncbi:MAG: tRNA lysidine(34) synthetase TilS [Rhizobiaceae bacterium]